MDDRTKSVIKARKSRHNKANIISVIVVIVMALIFLATITGVILYLKSLPMQELPIKEYYKI